MADVAASAAALVSEAAAGSEVVPHSVAVAASEAPVPSVRDLAIVAAASEGQ
ncbi:hypothetical protein JDN41_15000 [Rhodomicrobium udaipurense]|uniref:Uncharacterized protein n=1 Tax=Rhodomicrobium udaipurense TaxID=1202716 RepID=A0A8I1GHB8_9HYPH|nr:hypothetical protein [Rhodomicrobium udaipurense]